MSLPKIVEITYAIYQGLSKRRLCKKNVGRKVNNASGFSLRRNFTFSCTPFLSTQSTNLTCARDPIENLVPGQRTTSTPRDLSPEYGHAILVSGYLFLTAPNLSKHGCPISKMCPWCYSLIFVLPRLNRRSIYIRFIDKWF